MTDTNKQHSFFRKSQSVDGVETKYYEVDGVRYESLEDMPPHIKALWDEHDGMFSSIFANADALSTAASEGNFIETKSSWKRVRETFMASFLCLASIFTIFGILYDGVAPILMHEIYFDIAFYTLTTLACLCTLIVPFSNNDPITNTGGRLAAFIVYGTTLVAIVAFSNVSIYSGLPKALHFLNNEHGSITTTVVQKSNVGKRLECKERVYLSALTIWTDKHICTSDAFLQSINAGDKVEVTGNISPFGIEAIRIKRLDK